jgi:acetolactate synthase-1/2/3 large subunit
MTKHITKYATRITDPGDVGLAFDSAIYLAKNGRPGPVLIELPDDIQRTELPIQNHNHEYRRFISNSHRRIDERDIKNVSEMLSAAKSPLVIVGGGCREYPKILDVLRYNCLPHVSTWATKDMFVENDGWYCGGFGVSDNRAGNWAVQNADFILSLGCKLDFHQTGTNQKKFAPHATIVQVDIDFDEFGRGIDSYAIVGDVGEFVNRLNEELEKGCHISISDSTLKFRSDILGVSRHNPICKAEYYREENFVNPYVFMDGLSNHTAEDAIIIPDAGANLTWAMQGYKMRKKQRLFSSFNHSPMGYSICAAIGAQIAEPTKQVVCIIGDGGLQMNVQELETIVFNDLPVKIFVIDNGGYGIMRQTQDTWLEGRHTAIDENSGLGFPLFRRVFDSYGFGLGRYIGGHGSLDVIGEVLRWPSHAYCIVEVNPEARIIPKLESGHTLDDMWPYAKEDDK